MKPIAQPLPGYLEPFKYKYPFLKAGLRPIDEGEIISWYKNSPVYSDKSNKWIETKAAAFFDPECFRARVPIGPPNHTDLTEDQQAQYYTEWTFKGDGICAPMDMHINPELYHPRHVWYYGEMAKRRRGE